MVKQFRPPLGCYSLEFPAGLIDEGETAEAAALRELKEETGYKGEVVGVTPVTCLDPGLSNCTTQIVLVNINGDEAENINPTQQLGDGEFVEVILLPLDEFQMKIDDLLKKEKIMVDAKVYIFAMGMVQAFFKTQGAAHPEAVRPSRLRMKGRDSLSVTQGSYTGLQHLEMY
ncbi:hypothetical protein INR49_004118 [Caranx melampygus]|nr:hypothetical protein INR49_004118 [Caranx melampygus]